MNRPEATVEELLGLLPDLEDLEVLRLRLVSSAIRDPQKEWDSSSTKTTIDKRIVTADLADRALVEAEQALHEYVTMLHAGLRPFFAAWFSGNIAEAATELVTLGEQMEAGGRLVGARCCYRAALTVSLPLADKAPQILALRRIGRVSWSLGDLLEAVSYYERSAELARDAGDLNGEVVARTGLGNVRLWQGRWAEAEQSYHDALMLAEGGGPGSLLLERGQIYNNLGNVNTRLRRVDQAEIWFESAMRVWETISSPLDLAICLHNRAQLREVQERYEEAHADYMAALKLAVSAWLRSTIATDLAAWWLQDGHLTQAEEWGRVAEENAIKTGSPYLLGAVYLGRGRIALAREDADGFIFFEKALEIAREKGYPSLEAETLADYAVLRSQNGGQEEAVAYLERACDLFRELGALGELERAQHALREMRAGVDALEPEGEAPLAAAGD